MPRTPFQSQSRYEGGRRPWNLTAKTAKGTKGRPAGYQCKTDPEEIEACLNCPLPDCKVNWCPVLRDFKAQNKSEAAPAATGTTSKENTSGPVYHRRAGTSRKERK